MNINELVPLVERLKGGDQKAFDELYTNIWDNIYYVALRHTRNPSDAMDITQDVLITVSKEIYSLNSVFAFSSWLHRITYNKCINFLKKRSRLETVFLGDVEEQLIENRSEFQPDDMLMHNEIREQILEIIDDLPSEQKQAVLLYYFAELTTDEISTTMSISRNAVHQRLSRARSKIREKVDLISSDFKVNSILPMIPLAQLLQENSVNVCTNAIQKTVVSGALAKLSAPVAKSALSTLLVKLVAGALTLTVITGVVVITTQSNHSPQSEKTRENESKDTKPVITEVLTLEDFVGVNDANFILSGKQMQNGEYHDQFKQIVKANQIIQTDLYLGENDFDYSSYIVYYLDKQSKRLLIVERYDASHDGWQIAYQIKDNLEIIPNKAESIQLFEDYFVE